jgi:hypothetical protein
VDAHTFTKQAEIVSTSVICQKTDGNCFLGQKGVLMVEFMQQRTTIIYCKTLKELLWVIENKRLGMVTSGVVLLHDNARPLLALEHCWSILTGSCLTTLLTALISFRATTTYLPILRTDWDHSASAVTRN